MTGLFQFQRSAVQRSWLLSQTACLLLTLQCYLFLLLDLSFSPRFAELSKVPGMGDTFGPAVGPPRYILQWSARGCPAAKQFWLDA
jgi:hypothetical protein